MVRQTGYVIWPKPNILVQIASLAYMYLYSHNEVFYLSFRNIRTTYCLIKLMKGKALSLHQTHITFFKGYQLKVRVGKYPVYSLSVLSTFKIWNWMRLLSPTIYVLSLYECLNTSRLSSSTTLQNGKQHLS